MVSQPAPPPTPSLAARPGALAALTSTPRRKHTAYLAVVARTFRGNLARLVAMVALTTISIALVTGVGVLAPRIRDSVAAAQSAIHPTSGDAATAHDSAYSFQYMLFVADGVERISYVFPMIFAAVTALVVYMTITRLVTSERAQIGCLKTLGYSRRHILAKYVPFTAVGCAVGGGLGLLVGYTLVNPVLFAAVRDNADLPEVGHVVPVLGFVSAAAILVLMVVVTFGAAHMMAREQPTFLLTGLPPKGGGHVPLERLGWAWRRLAYKHKSTLRNILRYRVRLVMTVSSMLVSTALVFCGLALSFSLGATGDPTLEDTIRPISAVIVIAAILLNTVVVYNITNINIEERAREIATLKVLGYRDGEVVGYVFREILALTIIGVLVGLPAGWAAMRFIFNFLQFGSIDQVGWYVWPFTAALALASLGLADLLLFRKLLGTDMNGSLKTID